MITDKEKELVIEAVKTLNLDSSIELHPDTNSVSFAYFDIEQTEETEQVMCIGGVKERTKKVYICTEEIFTNYSYWELPDSDYVEFARTTSWLSAVGACAVRNKQHEVDNLLEGIALAYIATEEY